MTIFTIKAFNFFIGSSFGKDELYRLILFAPQGFELNVVGSGRFRFLITEKNAAKSKEREYNGECIPARRETIDISSMAIIR